MKKCKHPRSKNVAIIPHKGLRAKPTTKQPKIATVASPKVAVTMPSFTSTVCYTLCNHSSHHVNVTVCTATVAHQHQHGFAVGLARGRGARAWVCLRTREYIWVRNATKRNLSSFQHTSPCMLSDARHVARVRLRMEQPLVDPSVRNACGLRCVRSLQWQIPYEARGNRPAAALAWSGPRLSPLGSDRAQDWDIQTPVLCHPYYETHLARKRAVNSGLVVDMLVCKWRWPMTVHQTFAFVVATWRRY